MPAIAFRQFRLTPLTALIAVLLLSFWSTVALTQSESAKPVADHHIQVSVDEVSLNLVVRDRKDKPVSDLKPEDLAVTDGGARVNFSNFHFVSGQTEGDHLLAFVFDRMDSAAARSAREIAGKIIKGIPQGGFSFCVLRPEGRLRLYQDFTQDRSATIQAIGFATEPVKPGSSTSNADAPEKRLIAVVRSGADESGVRISAVLREKSQVLLASLQESQRVLQEQHAQPALAGLLALVRAEIRLPGRKTVVFVAQGLQTDSGTGEMLRSIIGAANRAGVSIYAVDANALNDQVTANLMATTAMGNAMANRAISPAPALSGPVAPGQFTDPSPAGMLRSEGEQFSRFESGTLASGKGPMADLAEATGGAYINAGDGLSKPLRRMVEDMTTYYEASYVPPIENFDGQFRAVTVKPKRGGLKIQSRLGYFALPSDSKSVARPFEAPLMKLFAEPQLPSDIKFRAQVLRLGDLSDGDENLVVVQVPIAELATRDDPNTNLYSLHVSVVAQVKDKSGTVIEHFSEDVPRHGALDAKEAARSEFIAMQRHFIAEPGEYTLEVAVLDQGGAKGGAQRINFEIPPDIPGPSLSDIALVQRIEPTVGQPDPEEPMRYGDGKVIPTLATQIPHGARELSFFFMVHPDPASSEPVRLEMEMMRGGESIAQMPLQFRKTIGPATVPYVASIQSASLPGGDYEVVERLTQGGKTVARTLPFRIEGPQMAGASMPGSSPADSDEEPSASDVELATNGHMGKLVTIRPLPASAVSAPSDDQLQAIVSAGRKLALGYMKSLPNFVCVEVTNRSVDVSGKGNWKPRDSMAELLRYQDDQETRTTLEVNGKRSSLTRTDMDSTLPISVGEFGGLLNLVFQPASKAGFEWKETGTLDDGGGTVQVLSYRVKAENATLALSDSTERIGVGFHGVVFIDPSTGGVRRITLEADDLPRKFSIHSASMSVDYGYVAIGQHDYLVPLRATVSLQRGRKGTELNEIAFRNYKRFASQSRIKVVQ